jgi:DtxR family transcriptional regulator, Mn-dependent transcriptional regulator
MAIADTLTASLEDYLEAIFHIIAEKEAVRPKDIAKRLEVSNASVTGALRALADRELIRYSPYDVITLTAEGKTAAKDVIRRHEVLRDFFCKVLSIEESEADKAACQMEHSIPQVVLERFIQFVEFIEVCPRGGAKWIAGFGYFCDHNNTKGNCEKCISLALDEAASARRNQGERSTAMTGNLKNLKSGQKGRVLKVHSHGEIKRRIVEMGIVPGAVVEVEKIAPMGDPIDIKVKGYHFSLRKEDAEKIEIEAL